MNILAIECTHGVLGIGLLHGGAVRDMRGAAWQKTAESIVPLIDRIMMDAGALPGSLDAVAVSSGPGSFTALRIGMSVAKGVACGLGIPVVPVPTLPSMAASLPSGFGAEAVMAVVESRKGEYYYSVFRTADLAAFRWDAPVERGGAEAVLAELASHPHATAVVGRHLEPLQDALLAGGARVVGADFFTAAALFPMAGRLLSTGGGADAGSVVPDYHQEFVSGSTQVGPGGVGGK
ncbi:tRNA (adenosine(37)-N6)-threonylcarbamoyltransferase complex dimerization subunit type 1 TsaB [Pelodictyon luteolum]|uniref:Protease, putative n=1 Tax=Chlorobium luteolum (strain DSM 273 / BCRC 81028 / 2530) TaxID=319225 RepID=Q3B6P5_CHLL3|nr:tRNA (adenosine(37)-N6)-threonylcarbamoyltransferase complex dimerization subunit type 1 TsaB [Pelodictyon luteolum]ABB22986.1 protease, putative [Pelodictyon luteolum DSM 273]